MSNDILQILEARATQRSGVEGPSKVTVFGTEPPVIAKTTYIDITKTLMKQIIRKKNLGDSY